MVELQSEQNHEYELGYLEWLPLTRWSVIQARLLLTARAWAACVSWYQETIILEDDGRVPQGFAGRGNKIFGECEIQEIEEKG